MYMESLMFQLQHFYSQGYGVDMRKILLLRLKMYRPCFKPPKSLRFLASARVAIF